MFADKHMAHYIGGVLQYSNCSEGTNHGVLAVKPRKALIRRVQLFWGVPIYSGRKEA